MAGFASIASKFFGSAIDRRLKIYVPTVDAINALEPEVERLSDDQLRARTAEFRSQIEAGAPLKDLLNGRLDDFALEPNDILFVPDSSSKTALYRGSEAIIQMATGLVIWRR